MQDILSELMSASKSIFGKEDEDNATVDSSDSLSAFLASHNEPTQTSQTGPNYAALRSALLGLTDEGENEGSTGDNIAYYSTGKEQSSPSEKILSSESQKECAQLASSQTKHNVIKSRTPPSIDFGAKVNQVEKRIDNYVENFSSLVTDLNNLTTNVEVDVDVTKQKEERSIIHEESMSTVNKKSTEVRVNLQATAAKGEDTNAEIAYNMRENARNLNTPLSMDEYTEGFDSNHQVEMFLQVSASATESSGDQNDLKQFNTNSEFSSESLDSYDSYTDDFTESGGSYTSGSI